VTRRWAALVPGLVAVAVVAAIASLLTSLLPASISVITFGMLTGILIANTTGVAERLQPGIRVAITRLLRAGIVLMGARLSLSAVLNTSLGAVAVILACFALALVTVLWAGRRFGIPPRLALLIGVGTAICGNSAIVATAPIIRAEDREVSFALSTITIFGTLAVLLYPVIGLWMGLSENVFGHWAGVAVNDTSQVAATGFAFSTLAGETATVVKLTRNLLLGPVLIAIALMQPAEEADGTARPSGTRRLLRAVPLFVVGFVVAAALNSIGLIPPELDGPISTVSGWLILLAIVGVGMSTRLGEMRQIGWKPMVVGLVASGVLAAVALGITSVVYAAR
jgi:uncharacterized integral membrane protein (TIGR00698 family)